MCVHVLLCSTLCDPMDCNPPVPLSMGFSRQEFWSGLPCPPPGDLPDAGIKPVSLMSSELATSATWEGPGGLGLGLGLRLGIGLGLGKAQVVQFSSVAQSCPTLCDPMNCSTPGLPVHHHLPKFTQTHIHCVRDAIQPSHPLSSPSPPAPNPSQHQSLFQ